MDNNDGWTVCPHTIQNGKGWWRDFKIMHKLYKSEKVNDIIHPCSRCGILLRPTNRTLVACGAIDSLLFSVLGAFGIYTTRERLLGDALWPYVLFAIAMVAPLIFTRNIARSIMLSLLPWEPSKEYIEGQKQSEIVAAQYDKGLWYGIVIPLLVVSAVSLLQKIFLR